MATAVENPRRSSGCFTWVLLVRIGQVEAGDVPLIFTLRQSQANPLSAADADSFSADDFNYDQDQRLVMSVFLFSRHCCNSLLS